MSAKRRPLTERFWEKVNRPSLHNCWEWVGTKNSGGYGKIWFNGRNLYAHRVSYEVAKGKIPDGLEIDHLCRNRGCVNPDHLEIVSSSENTRRGLTPIIAGRRMGSKTHCPKEHPYDLFNTRIDSQGFRRCKTCEYSQQQIRRYRRRKVPSVMPGMEG